MPVTTRTHARLTPALLAAPVVCGWLLLNAASGKDLPVTNPVPPQTLALSAPKLLPAKGQPAEGNLPAPVDKPAEPAADQGDEADGELPPPDDSSDAEALPDEEGQEGNLPEPLRDLAFHTIRPEGESPDDVAADRFSQAGDAVPVGHCLPERWFAYHWVAPGLCHRPLYFEEPNLERHGRTYHCLQPIVSGVHFFGTVPILPYRMVVEPCHDCNYTYGHRRPGSLAEVEPHWLPFRCDAAFVEAAVIAGLVIVVP